MVEYISGRAIEYISLLVPEYVSENDLFSFLMNDEEIWMEEERGESEEDSGGKRREGEEGREGKD